MIKIENTDVCGWEAGIRGMRNPMNSWKMSDSGWFELEDWQKADTGETFQYRIGENDRKLMKSLSKAGNDHAKFLRMINVTCDIVAPRYFYLEFDTYKVGTVCNSCSTMHKITEKEFTLDDFSHDYIDDTSLLWMIPDELNKWRKLYLETKDKTYWYRLIQLLPQSYNQRRTVQMNYQVLKNMYHARKNHKLDEWREFCKWCESLPYFKEICVGTEE